MKLKFIDCNCQIGRNATSQPFSVFYSPEELKEILMPLNIVKAFCYHSAARDTACCGGNELLLDTIRNDSFYLPSYTVIPNSACDSLTAEELETEVSNNDIRLIRMFPKNHNYSMGIWNIGRLFDFLDTNKLTVVISYKDISSDCLFEILTHFRRVKIILTSIGYSGRDTVQLMKKFDNLFVDTSYAAPDGIEFITEMFGSERIIFGTSAPFASPNAYVGRVILASVSDRDKENIAYKNIIRLTGAEV